MATKQKAFRLSDTAINYLEEFGEKNNLNQTESLERIIREHKSQSESEIDLIANKVIEKFDDKYKNLFTRLRLATNYTEKNAQVILEVLNSLIINMDYDDAYTSTLFKSKILEESEKEVKRRIAEYKQINDYR